MIVHRICHRILRVTLTMTVIVDYQISGQPHQPIREVALFRIVLIKRLVDANENILGQIFGGIDAGGKSVSEVEDPSGVI